MLFVGCGCEHYFWLYHSPPLKTYRWTFDFKKNRKETTVINYTDTEKSSLLEQARSSPLKYYLRFAVLSVTLSYKYLHLPTVCKLILYLLPVCKHVYIVLCTSHFTCIKLLLTYYTGNLSIIHSPWRRWSQKLYQYPK